MTHTAFRAALAALGLTQTGAATALRVDPRTVRRWASGERPVPGTVERLLEMMARQCADCGYPLDDKPVFLGGVWFCSTCNPAMDVLSRVLTSNE